MNQNRLPKQLFLLLIALIVFHKLFFVIGKSRPSIERFIKSKANYSRMRNAYPTFATAAEAKRILPVGAKVSIAGLSPFGENIAARYSLYPLEIVKDADYLIDFTPPSNNQMPYKVGKNISTGAVIYAKGGFPSLSNQKIAVETPPLKLFIQFVLMVMFEAGIGLLVLRLIKIPINKGNMLWAATTGYLVGFCIFTSLLWIGMLLGVTLEAKALWMIGLFITAALLVLSLKKKSYLESTSFIQNPKSRVIELFKALLIAYIVLIMAWSVSNPVKDWDAMANWVIKSKVLYHEKALDFHYTKENHNTYPILWPLHIAAQFSLFDTDQDEIAVWSSALFFLVLIIQLFQGAYLVGAGPPFSYATLLAFMTFFVSPNSTTLALPENVFCALLAGMVLSIVLWLRSPIKTCYLTLSIFLALGLCLVKLEGFIAVLLVIVALIATNIGLVLAPRTRSYFLTLLIFTGLPALWMIWMMQQGFLGSGSHLQDGITINKLFLLFILNANHFVRSGEFLIFLFGFIYFIYYPNRRKWHISEKFLLKTLILLMLFKWVATIGWTEEMLLAPGIFPDGAMRLFLHVSPVLLFLFCSRTAQRE